MDHETDKDNGQGYDDSVHLKPLPTPHIQSRNLDKLCQEQEGTLTKIILLDGKHIWLNSDTHTDKEHIKNIIQQRQGIDFKSYQLTQAIMQETGINQEIHIHMRSTMQGGTPGTKQKNTSKGARKTTGHTKEARMRKLSSNHLPNPRRNPEHRAPRPAHPTLQPHPV